MCIFLGDIARKREGGGVLGAEYFCRLLYVLWLLPPDSVPETLSVSCPAGAVALQKRWLGPPVFMGDRWVPQMSPLLMLKGGKIKRT